MGDEVSKYPLKMVVINPKLYIDLVFQQPTIEGVIKACQDI